MKPMPGSFARRRAPRAAFTPFAFVALAVVASSAAAAACVGDDDFLPKYGSATGLGGNNEPLNEDAAAETVSNATTTGSTTTTTIKGCIPGSTKDLYIQTYAKSCTVSWSKDIEALMASPTGWDCTNSGCHGGSTTPKLTGKPDDDYNTLVGFAGSFPRVYINPCTNDPNASSMGCNVTDNNSSCDPAMTSMPVSTGAGNHSATSAEVTKLFTWLACGAPDN